ncbi:3-hydroxyacyl-CoA dehydrogenase family protein [Rhodococcus fascians]|nr:3-hydroxyacyl-CoA dehydrogenase family protein [Rhodococcus fascians]MBY4114684.1 3-hydroxyacyl-CoA dehydrogenase family protein [Rhodococcus fascians]
MHEVEAVVPRRVGVFGGGRMGSGIAHAFLVVGATVSVVETDPGAVSSASARIEASVRKADERGLLADGVNSVLARLTCSTDTSVLSDTDLVIEAVPEDATLKASILSRLETIAARAVLATNTSSLSVDALADGLIDPSRLLGLHFFNPVPASSLVEVVVGARTDKGVATRAERWVEGIGKAAIVVADSPGFASSRLGVVLALEAMRMVESGVASAEDIDTAMTLGYKHPVGPLRTTDIVGLDVRLAIAEHLTREIGDRFTPPQILLDKVAAGELGRKAGQGFFSW